MAEDYNPAWSVGGQPSFDAPHHNLFLNWLKPKPVVAPPVSNAGMATLPVPSEAAPAQSQLGGFSFSSLVKDPNFHGFLAALSSNLDPEGPGGAVGRAAGGMIRAKAAQKAMEGQESQNKGYMDEVISILRSKAGLTPKGQIGATSVEKTDTGYKINVDTQNDPAKMPVGTGTVLAPPEEPAIPRVSPVQLPQGTQQTSNLSMRDLYPFYSALL
jgi:hypothetical protein